MTAARPVLPYGRQTIEQDDIDAVVEVLQGGWLTGGPAVERFEAAFAAAVEAPHAVVCSSGTAALHLACVDLGLAPGDAAIVPAVTFVATANAVVYCGADPVFADVDPDTGLMRPDHLASALVRAHRAGLKPKAVLPVHLNGQVCAMPEIGAAARRLDLAVIEDACHAVGGVGRDGGNGAPSPVGACRHGTMTVFSLHPVKTVTMGEGGVVTCADATRAQRLRRLRNHGVERLAEAFADAGLARDDAGRVNPWYMEFPDVGFNYRASDIHCALGLSQIGKLQRFVSVRRDLVACYRQELHRLEPVVRPIGLAPDGDPAWHLAVVLVDFEAAGVGRGEVMRRLLAEGVGSQVHYVPLHLQPRFRRRYGDLSLPGARAYYDRCLSLPLFCQMRPDDVRHVVDALGRALGLGGGK